MKFQVGQLVVRWGQFINKITKIDDEYYYFRQIFYREYEWEVNTQYTGCDKIETFEHDCRHLRNELSEEQKAEWL